MGKSKQIQSSVVHSTGKFDILYQDENSASGALAQLLRTSPCARQAFWKIARGPTAPENLPAKLVIDHLHLTDQGREIDLLLHGGDFGVIVECKVRDGKKPYQFDAYVAYWRRTRSTEPHLVWLLETDQPVLGDDRYPVTTITWRMLKEALIAAAETASIMEDILLRDFCTALARAGIGQRARDKIRPAKRAIGYEREHAARILNCIIAESDGITGKPITINTLPPALHAGRTEWSKLIDDNWVERIWLYFTPLTTGINVKGPYYFRAQILLYQGGFCNKHSRKLNMVPKWSDKLRAKNLSLIRNEPKTWNRWMPLAPREGVHTDIRYIFAEERVSDAKGRFPFDWRSDAEAIKAGVAYLRHFVRLFDQVLLNE